MMMTVMMMMMMIIMMMMMMMMIMMMMIIMMMMMIIMMIMMMMMMMTTIMIVIAFKGAIRDFYNLLTAPRTVSNTHALVARAQSCANHVKHIERVSHATCHVTCHLLRRDSSAVKFDRAQIAFILASFYWLNH